MGLVAWYLLIHTCAWSLPLPDSFNGCIPLLVGDTLHVSNHTDESADWYYAVPVRKAYDNMIPGGEPMGIGVDTLLYEVFLLYAGESELCLVLDSCSVLPVPGVFYLITDPPPELLQDTLLCVEPLHLQYPDFVELLGFLPRTHFQVEY